MSAAGAQKLFLHRLPTNASIMSENEGPEKRPDARAFLMSTAKRSLEDALDGCWAY